MGGEMNKRIYKLTHKLPKDILETLKILNSVREATPYYLREILLPKFKDKSKTERIIRKARKLGYIAWNGYYWHLTVKGKTLLCLSPDEHKIYYSFDILRHKHAKNDEDLPFIMFAKKHNCKERASKAQILQEIINTFPLFLRIYRPPNSQIIFHRRTFEDVISFRLILKGIIAYPSLIREVLNELTVRFYGKIVFLTNELGEPDFITFNKEVVRVLGKDEESSPNV